MVFAAMLLVVFTAGNCASLRELTVVLGNDTSHVLTDVQVMFDGFQSLAVGIAPNAHKGEGGVNVALPRSALVTWRTPDGHLHEQTVLVRSALPDGYSGDVWFVIRSDNRVEVRHRPLDQTR